VNLPDVSDQIESIGQLIITLGSLGLFGKIWQGVGLLKNIELEVRNIQNQITAVDSRMTGVEEFMLHVRRDREILNIRIEDHERRITTLEREEN